MKRNPLFSVGGILILTTIACGDGEENSAETVVTDAASRPSVVMALPLTTSDDIAREHFVLGQRDLDLGHVARANQHFVQAVAQDQTLALAHLRAAQSASSFEDYRAHLEAADGLADQASEAEALLIEIETLAYEGNRDGQLAAADALVMLIPESPRAWLVLASVQDGFNEVDAARTSIARAIELAPDFAAAHLALANSMVLRRPWDPAAAADHARIAVELEPGEALPRDLLGDAYRAGGDLEAARIEYQRAAELDPSGSAYQQLGHVNSFLGDYAAARANYDEAIALAEGNARATYGTWRAFVHLHEGNPQGAIDELNALVDAVDAMDIPEPVGVKIGALGQVGWIAVHSGALAQAENANVRRAELVREQIAEAGTDEFRRAAEADLLFREGIIAAAGGDPGAAERIALEIIELREPDADPRKDEIAHDLMGMASFHAGAWQAAIDHMDQGNRNNVYNQYLRARAYEAMGDRAEAARLYRGIAENHFNNVFTAMLRAEALEKAE